jgi:hypothetical protein
LPPGHAHGSKEMSRCLVMGRMLLMHDSSHPNSKLLTVAYSYVSTMLYYSNGTRGSFLVNAQNCKNTSMWATPGYTVFFY